MRSEIFLKNYFWSKMLVSNNIINDIKHDMVAISTFWDIWFTTLVNHFTTHKKVEKGTILRFLKFLTVFDVGPFQNSKFLASRHAFLTSKCSKIQTVHPILINFFFNFRNFICFLDYVVKAQNFSIVSKIFAFFWFLTFFHIFSIKKAATRWKIVRIFFFRDFCHFFHQIFRFCPHIWHLFFSPSIDLSQYHKKSKKFRKTHGCNRYTTLICLCVLAGSKVGKY